MQKLTEIILDNGLQNELITDVMLHQLLPGTNNARSSMINKALKSGEVIRLRRGLMMAASKYQQRKWSLFYLANQMRPTSYISFESALSFHGWIPEHVVTTTSAYQSDRYSIIDNHFGCFRYTSIPTRAYTFLTDVSRASFDHEQFFLIASPLRALLDLVYLNKIPWQGIEFLTENLRIEEENLLQSSPHHFPPLYSVYRSKITNQFLRKLEKEVLSYGQPNH